MHWASVSRETRGGDALDQPRQVLFSWHRAPGRHEEPSRVRASSAEKRLRSSHGHRCIHHPRSRGALVDEPTFDIFGSGRI